MSLQRRALALLASAALAMLPVSPASAAPSAPAPSTQKATFGLQPATRGKPDARPYLSYQTSPGGTFTDNVALLNYSAIPLDLQVYISNLSNTVNGSLDVAASSAAPVDAASWTHLNGGPRTVHVPAGSAKGPTMALLPVGLAVPANASPGDHVAAMVASLQTIGKNPKGENVRLLQRVALRIFIRVNGAINSHYTIQHLKVNYHDSWNPIGAGSADVSYTIRNDGNVSLGVSQKVKISGWFGSTGTVPALGDVPVLLPGNTIDVHLRVKKVWPELMVKAKVTLTSIRAGSSTDTLLPPNHASASTWAVPWALLILIVLFVALAFAAVRWAKSGARSYSGRRRSK